MSTIDNPQQIVPVGQVPAVQYAAPGLPRAGGPDAGADSAGITAKDVWRIVKQRKVLIIVMWSVFYLLVLVTTFLVYRFAPAYKNEAYVRLIPPMGEQWGSLQEAILPKDYIAHRLATEANGILNPATLLDVLAQPEIKATEFDRWYGDDFDKCLYDFERMLSVAPMRDTFLISVAIAVRKKEEAKLIVNTVVQRYVLRSKSSIGSENTRRLESLKTTKAEVKESLDDTRERIHELRSRRDMPAIESEREVMTDTAAVLNNTLAELHAREADIQAQLATIRGMDPRNLPLSAEMRVIIESDPILRFYRQQVEAMDIQIQVELKNGMGPEHRQMKRLVDMRNGYFQMEVMRREELTDDLRARQVESLGQELARIRNMLATVYDQLTEKQNTQRDLDRVITEFNNLTTDEERLSEELKEVGLALLQAQNTASIQEKEGRLEPIMAQRDPYLPSRPNFILYLGGGFVLSLLAAVGLAFLREITDQAVRTPIDVARFGRLSVLGCVPMLDDEEADIDEIELATRSAPHSLVAEAFRQIRAHLTFSGPLESQKVLLITSPRPEDGKTATAVNLGVTFAQGNQRVLIIDCNFRRPCIRQAFQGTHPEGLSNALVGQATLEQAVSKTDLPNLDVMTSGPMPPNPAELLGSPAMRELLQTAGKSYDRVLLDGPPCLLISDSLILATLVDATVLVARAATTSKGALRRAREQFQRINARVIGAILNGVQTRAGGYFRQQYREFYDYTNEEIVPQELTGATREIDAGPTDAGGTDKA